MKIGMAVNSGHEDKKRELVALLDKASLLPIDLGLWVEGRPFDVTLCALADQLDPPQADIDHLFGLLS